MGEIHFDLPYFFIQIYGDWADGKGHTDIYTYQGFLGGLVGIGGGIFLSPILLIVL